MVCRRMQKCDNQINCSSGTASSSQIAEYGKSQASDISVSAQKLQRQRTRYVLATEPGRRETSVWTNSNLGTNVNRIARTREPRCTGTLTAASSPIGATMPRYRSGLSRLVAGAGGVSGSQSPDLAFGHGGHQLLCSTEGRRALHRSGLYSACFITSTCNAPVSVKLPLTCTW
jgi:hypothetical protein